MGTFLTYDLFQNRHIGPSQEETEQMLKAIGVDSIESLMDQTIPSAIRIDPNLDLPEALSEFEYLKMLKDVGAKNKVFRSLIGLGYYNSITPSVILRNIFENPGWYTQYTPYQAEIAQGRLEALLNFQTMVSDLTGLPIANASLLDEGTAAAEAMAMFYSVNNKKRKGSEAKVFLVSDQAFPQTLDVLKTRAIPLGIEVKEIDLAKAKFEDSVFGVFIQYPDKEGSIQDYKAFCAKAKEAGVLVCVAADILSLTVLSPPGEWGADVAVGLTQRFGIPMGYGGPHAAFFATKDEYKRLLPGRIIGVSEGANGEPALRMALQTREQHIRRDKATSNICTAQALLAIMAGMYAVYHGPKGLKNIALRVHHLAAGLGKALKELGYELKHDHYFDTIAVVVASKDKQVLKRLAQKKGYNFYYDRRDVMISIDETVNSQEIEEIIAIFAEQKGKKATNLSHEPIMAIPSDIERMSTYLQHPVFSSYHSESKMMRYIKRLENRDLSLCHSMIPLGSCTMKLNAATELIPVSWPEFGSIHPFAPSDQVAGYQQIFEELEKYLCVCTGFTACSLQPNSGAQGEYAGLLTIRAYHLDRGDQHRNIALIPASAHGTNPASAVMAGMKVVVVKSDERGNIDVADLKEKAILHKEALASLMVTYPSTHGVFEADIKEICEIIHENGGLVYMDGANMNSQVGLTSPAAIGADVCHLNLHKTFAIPHGGGGPGMGPICVNDKLKPFLPGHALVETGGKQAISAVSAAPYGSASILLISYGYIRLLGAKGVVDSTRFAILNANYIKARLEGAYEVLYTGENGRAAHELIIDLNPYKAIGVLAEDVAKRLMDYGFHAPTLSFPVAGTIMIEPTESEDKAELDRFCEAMLEIKNEINEVATGKMDPKINVLTQAPHTVGIITSNEWNLPYSREKAAFPLKFVREVKFWPYVGRVNNAKGDRDLICTCPPIEMYEMD